MRAQVKGDNRRLVVTLTEGEAELIQQQLHAAWQRAGTWSKLGEELSELDDLIYDFLGGSATEDSVYPIVRPAE